MTARAWVLSLVFIAMSGTAGVSQVTEGVTTTPIAPDRNSRAYRAGFSEGCEHATVGNTRNETRFGSDFNYHEGWVAGYHSCYSHNSLNTNNDPNGPLKF